MASDNSAEVARKSKTKFSPILRTAVAYLLNDFGDQIPVRMLLDSCSTTNLIQRHVADQLALKGGSVCLQLSVAGGSQTKTTKERNVQFKLKSLDGKFLTGPILATTIKQVVQPLQQTTFNQEDYVQTRNVKLIDPPTKERKEVHLLLGEPYFSQYTIGIHKMGKLEEPGVVKTSFGNVLCGAHPERMNGQKAKVLVSLPPSDVNWLWELDRAGIEEEKELTVEEEEAEQFMNQYTTYDEMERRYYTRLPWRKDPKDVLGNNFERAKAISNSMMRRNKKHLDLIKEAFEQLEKNGFSEEVPADEVTPDDNRFVYYLETHAVIRPERETTRARLVMNAASKDAMTKQSLNDCLHKGKNMISLIPEVLIRFRQNRFGLVVDISKMFHNIGLTQTSHDRDAVRFLQPSFNGGEPRHMRHKCLPFGLTSSPFQAIFVLDKHLNEMKNKDTKKANHIQAIQRGMYVDDTVISADSKKDIEKILEAMKACFLSCGMNFHKVITNNNKLLLTSLNAKDILQKQVTTVLGVKWDTASDTLGLTETATQKKEGLTHTKRNVLSQLASVHDPLGLISPMAILGKVLMQDIWEQKLDWDDPLPKELLERYTSWKKEIPLLQQVGMPRWLGYEKKDKIYLASFGDSSLKSYAAVIYLVVKKRSGETISNVVMAKSRVAPKRLFKVKKLKCEKMTITRLELCGQVLNAKLAKFVGDVLQMPKENVYLFCDSTVTLGRIQQGPSNYCQYVGNRVKKCLEDYKANQYSYVSTKENPADLATRGVKATELANSNMWWHGPNFLTKPVVDWQNVTPQLNEEEKSMDNQEKTKTVQQPMICVIMSVPDFVTTLEKRTNNWGKLVRIVAYVRRFLSNLKERGREKVKKCVSDVHAITFEEFNDAELVWLQHIQAQSFQEEIKCCLKGQPVTTRLKDALPFMDKRDLLCHNSRIKHNEDMTPNPIILPKKNELAEKLVLYYHQQLKHSSAETTYVFLRRRFVLQGGRRELKRILHLCKNRRCRPLKMVKVKESTLPHYRVDHADPFKHASFDICGPCQVKHKCDLEDCPHEKFAKAYIGVFCCNSTRYIHVEALPNMTSRAVMEAFEKFFSRRGVPTTMISDQGRQILSVRKELQSWWDNIKIKKIQEQIAPKGINWHLTNAYAPNENSLAESAVKIVKTSLLKTFKHGHLSYREFEVALISCELVINQRPLGYLREDSDHLLPVSPCDLVLGRKLSLVPEDHRKETKKTTDLSRMVKHRQRLISNFWKRFNVDYLDSLSYTRLWRESKVTELKPGSVCQIIDKLTPRGKFNLGVVQEVYRGRDGEIRSATLRLPSGAETRRQARQLALFEHADSTEES